MCSLQSLATSTQRKIRVAPFHMVHYSAFCINLKPHGMKRWSKSDPRLQDDQVLPNGVYGLSSHLAEKQRSKDVHPMEGRGRNQGKLNRLVQMLPQAPSQYREEHGTWPIRGFIQTNACGGDDKENLMCLLWGETKYKVGEEMVAASQAQGSKSAVRPSPSSFSSTSVSNDGFTFLKRDGRFRIWTSLRNCSPRGFCRGQTGRHQSLLPSCPHLAQGQPACRSEADPRFWAIPRPGPHAAILGNLRPGPSQVPRHWGNHQCTSSPASNSVPPGSNATILTKAQHPPSSFIQTF